MRALVTGACGGLGRAIVSALAADGASIAACDLASALERGGAPPEAAASVAFDMRDHDAVRAGVESAASSLGGLDVVVANAAVIATIHRAERFPVESWQGDIDTNLTGQFVLVQAAWPLLLESAEAGRSPAVVLISSASAEDGLPGQVAYTASKAGLVGMARTLAAEWGPRGVRVNVVMPGMIATPKVRALPEGLLSGIASGVPLRRIGEPSELASAVAFLAGPSSSYVHGQVLRVDGGMALMSQSLATGPER